MANDINDFALQKAEAAAANLWAFGTAVFPFANGAMLQRHVEQEVTDTAIAFAVHVRRILDNRNIHMQFALDDPYWQWAPAQNMTKVAVLRDALNRIVHATKFTVGFERLPDHAHKIAGGAICVLYLKTETDRREESLIDVFSLAACFYHRVLPVLLPAGGE
jgi:hypothetical protein